MCILKNEYSDIGVKPKKSKYYSILKKIELQDLGKIAKQTTLF